MSLEINWLVFALVFAGLFLFGLVVNALVVILDRYKALEGRRALLVVLGVGGTLLGAVWVIGIVPAVLVGLLFAASGIPMIGGEWARDAQDRRKALEECKVFTATTNERGMDAESLTGRLSLASGDHQSSECQSGNPAECEKGAG